MGADHVARHVPDAALMSLAHEQGGRILCIHSVKQEALTKDDDWLLIAREAADVVLSVLARSAAGRVHLALSCPVALALALGMVLGTQSGVTVYKWFRREGLRPVLSLDMLHEGT